MFKGMAIKKYFKKMYPYLKLRYGRAKYYSKGQVLSVIRDFGYKEQYAIYALAIYVAKDEFELLTDEYTEAEIEAARQEIAGRFFDGNTQYTCDHRLKMQRSDEIDNFINTPSLCGSSGDSGDSSGGDSSGGGGD